MHPRLAATLGIADGDWVTVESRRGHCTLRASVVTTIRPDTVFIPYHWAGRKSANQLTISAQDPISKIPEYKVCAVRVRKASAPPEYATSSSRSSKRDRQPNRHARSRPVRILHRSRPLHRLPGVRAGLHRVRHAQGAVDDPARRTWTARDSTQTVPVVCMHCDSPTCAEVCPADAIKRTEDGVVQTARKPRCIACNNCVLACPFGVPKMNTRDEPDDEVRHVLRPHVGRAQADVRLGLSEPGAGLRHARGDGAAAAARAAGQRVSVRRCRRSAPRST